MSATSSGRSFHLIASQLRTKQSSLNCPNHVWWTKSSIKKRIIVRQTIQSMFVVQTLAQLRTGLREKEKKRWMKNGKKWVQSTLSAGKLQSVDGRTNVSCTGHGDRLHHSCWRCSKMTLQETSQLQGRRDSFTLQPDPSLCCRAHGDVHPY